MEVEVIEALSREMQRLIILHTNDIHSFFETMPRISSVLDDYRSTYEKDELLIVDCGDHLDRMRMETEGSEGAANIAMMNEAGYEAAILGNNEGLTYTEEVLQRLYTQECRFPVIGSNMRRSDTGQLPDWLVPYVWLTKQKLRIALIGVTIDFNDFYTLLGWDLEDPLTVVSRLVRQLREEADLIIVLSHLGLSKDKQMAEAIPGIDVILGGHTHHLLEEPLQLGETYIGGAGKFGQYVGKMELVYDLTARRLRSVRGECLPTLQWQDAPISRQIWDQHRHRSAQSLNVPLVSIAEPMQVSWYEESDLGNLLARSLMKWTNTEIGLVNAGQLLGSLRAGMLTKEALLGLCPSPINPCSMMLKGEQLLQALEESLIEDFYTMPIRGYGFRGARLGKLCVAGLKINYDLGQPPYQRIRSVLHRGKELDPEEHYQVGTIDMFTFKVGYESLSRGSEVRFFMPEFIRDLLAHELSDLESLAACTERHWHAI